MSELKHNIQQCVSDMHEWYDENKLVINKSKSSVMLATTRQRILHIDYNDLDVHIGDYKLVQSDCIDYLGVKIDETISWNKQTDSICKQLVFIISRFSRLKHLLPSHMLMLIYSSIIYTTKIDGVVCPPNISETVAGRLVKLAHRQRIASTTIRLIKKKITVHFSNFSKSNSANRRWPRFG